MLCERMRNVEGEGHQHTKQRKKVQGEGDEQAMRGKARSGKEDTDRRQIHEREDGWGKGQNTQIERRATQEKKGEVRRRVGESE
jgi:hypothetical protein